MWIPAPLTNNKNWCGPSALAYLLSAFNVSVSPAEVVSKIGNHINEVGTTLLELRKAAESYGVNCQSLEADYANLTNCTFPCIAHMRNNHYIVLTEVKGDIVTAYDPSLGDIKLHEREFLEAWSKIVLVPIGKPRRLNPLIERLQKQPTGLFKRALMVVAPYSGALVLALVAVVINSLLSMTLPLAIYFYIDRLINHQDGIEQLILIMSVATIIQILLTIGGRMLYSRVSNAVLYDLRMQFMRRVMTFTHDVLLKLAPADLLSRLLNDISVIQQFMSSSLFSFFINGGTFVLVSIALLFLDLKIGLITLAGAVATGLTYYLFERPIEAASKEMLQRKSEMTNRAQHMLGNFEVIQGYTREQMELSGFSQTLASNWRAGMRLDFLAVQSSSLSTLITSMTVICMFWISGYRILHGSMTIGTLVGLSMLSNQAFQLAAGLLKQNLDLKSVRVAANRFYEVVEQMEAEPEGRISLPSLHGEITFEQVGYTYPNGYSLKNISFRITPGSIAAICGPNGGGKSTLLNLIRGNYVPSSGIIKIDDISTREVARFSLNSYICYISQDPRLLDGTIRYNILYGGLYATPGELDAAAQLSGLGNHIASLPDGLDTKLVRGGMNLSAGQRQMVALARAILRKPRIIICDEATSNFDVQAEVAFLSQLRTLFPGATILVVSHRPWVVEKASTILVVQDGGVTTMSSDQQRKLVLQSLHQIDDQAKLRGNGKQILQRTH